MAEVSISRLEEKIQLLLKKMQFVREENLRLQEKTEQQQRLLQEEQNRVKDMEHQVALLKIANAQNTDGKQSTEINKALRSAVNQYIHEIDNCIARLNE